MRGTLSFGIVAGVTLLASGASAMDKPQQLTVAELLASAVAPFNKSEMTGKTVVLGRYKGTIVVADYFCGDVCPDRTRRIVHFQVEASECQRTGGVVVKELVPGRSSVARMDFCEPAVLAKLVN